METTQTEYKLSPNNHHSLLVREINWMETAIAMPTTTDYAPYSLGKLIEWKLPYEIVP
jgi:hypothetical protein